MHESSIFAMTSTFSASLSKRMVVLMSEVASCKGTTRDQPQTLLDGLKSIIDADAWLWVALDENQNSVVHRPLGDIDVRLSEEAFSRLTRAIRENSLSLPDSASITNLSIQKNHFTWTRQLAMPDKSWPEAIAIRHDHWGTGVDHSLYSAYPLDDNRCSIVCFFWRVGRDAFTNLDQRVCHLILGTVRWLHEAAATTSYGWLENELTPRQKTVLRKLLDGKTKRGIAQSLGLSEPTVGGHITQIYRSFGINSQVELMRLFQSHHGYEPHISTQNQLDRQNC